MEAKYAPLPIRNPDRGLQNSQRSSGVPEEMLQQRLALTGKFNRAFEQRFNQKQVRAYGGAYEDAIKLMKSQDLAAFDLSLESDAMRRLMVRIPSAKGACWLVA